jgi:hypothetical protein
MRFILILDMNTDRYRIAVHNLTCEELREFDGQYDSLLQRLLGALEAGDVVPLDVGLLGDDGRIEPGPQLGLLGVVPVLAVAVLALGLWPRGDGCVATVGARPRAALVEDGADLLGAAEVLGELGGDGLPDFGVLLVLEVGLEVLERIHVERERLDIVAGIVLLDRLLHVLDRLLLEVAVHRERRSLCGGHRRIGGGIGRGGRGLGSQAADSGGAAVVSSRWDLTRRGDHTRGWGREGDGRGTKTRRSIGDEKRRSVSRLLFLFIFWFGEKFDLLHLTLSFYWFEKKNSYLLLIFMSPFL